MKFGRIPLADAKGSILAHSLTIGGKRVRKGTIVDAGLIGLLEAEGISDIIAARLSDSDAGENEAAAAIAGPLSGNGIRADAASTGRVNLFAEIDGLFTASKAVVDAVNAISPDITLATLPDFTRVSRGRMVATVKIIPFATDKAAVSRAVECAAGAMALKAFTPTDVALVQTTLPGFQQKLIDKTVHVTEARLAMMGSRVSETHVCAHDADAIAALVREAAGRTGMVIVFGASAVADADDVIPHSIRIAGGRVERFGMPVDPGNLLVLGSVGDVPVLGAPGCARSPKENGFDWVLGRLLAGIPVTYDDIGRMGVGGLLDEIIIRPQPRAQEKTDGLAVKAVVLAAGMSRRMGKTNKLTAEFDGKPLVSYPVKAANEAELETLVVLGHEKDAVADALSGLDYVAVDNPDFAVGMSTSFRAAARELKDAADGVIVMLADMPGVDAGIVRALVERFRESNGTVVVRAAHNGKPGNPIVLPAALLERAEHLSGDVGARHLIDASGYDQVLVEAGPAALHDIDTPSQLDSLRS